MNAASGAWWRRIILVYPKSCSGMHEALPGSLKEEATGNHAPFFITFFWEGERAMARLASTVFRVCWRSILKNDKTSYPFATIVSSRA